MPSVHISNKDLGTKLCEAMGVEPGRVKDAALVFYPGDVTAVTFTMMVPRDVIEAVFEAMRNPRISELHAGLTDFTRQLGEQQTEAIPAVDPNHWSTDFYGPGRNPGGQ